MNLKKILIVVAAVVCAVFSVSGAPGDPYKWTPFSPNVSYSFLDAPDKVPMPTRDDAARNCNIQGTKGSGWWVFHWGPRANGNLTTNNNRIVRDEIIDPMLARMNEEFAYFRDVMGWPPDSRARKGLRSAIYLYGSGTGCSDRESDSTAQGGWQSSDGADPVVLLSWRPVLAFHGPSYTAAGYSDIAYQTGAVVHEGIHAIFASMPTQRSAPDWFHEGSNTWLQQQADAQRSNRYGEWADLNGPAFMAPFMPIECYSGWLQDGSFGGPRAEGVNRYEDASGNIFTQGGSGRTQICTWRTWLGGNQYGNGFPSFLGEWMGNGVIPWLWMNFSSGDIVLRALSRGIGDAQTKRLISEYRAKQATLDLRNWTESARSLMSGRRFGVNIGPEWQPNWINCPTWRSTPYAITTNSDGVLTPDPLTLPGWTGANQIPLTIPADMNTVSIDFMPDSANMTMQLAYRDVGGNAVYSELVTAPAGGTATAQLRLDTRPQMGPANTSNRGVVIAVISNTRYTGDVNLLRTYKYPYKIRIKDGVTTANVNTQWFNTPNMRMSPPYQTGNTSADGANRVSALGRAPGFFNVKADRAGILRVNYTLGSPGNVNFDIYNTAGKLVKSVPTGYKASGDNQAEINLRSMGVPSGTYVVRMRDVPAMSKAVAFVK